MKNKETLEEAAKRIVLETFNETFSKYPRGGKLSNETIIGVLTVFFILGSEWQKERMYSEEEVLKIIDLLFHKYASSFRVDAKEDFLLSKKK